MEIDSDLADYDIDFEDTKDIILTVASENSTQISKFAELRDKASKYPLDGNVKDKPWLCEGVNASDFFNFGLGEHQWK